VLVVLHANDNSQRLKQALISIALTIEHRRKTDKKPRECWRKRKLAQDYKQIQLMLTPETRGRFIA
jgi:hypothetical protein